MAEMAVMMGSQQGASIANQVVNQDFQDMCASLQENQSNLQNSIQSFSAQVSQAESKNTQLFGKIFTGALNHVTSKESDQSQVASQMQDYIFKSISVHQPQAYYVLVGASKFDQAFAHGTMYTPQGQVWKNIFRTGDWEYDQTSDSFWQMQSVPLFSTQTDADTGKQVQDSSQAAYNSIFTEYFAYAQSYEIQCEITLYKVQYPFFVGILFNKARWISGNADSLTKARLFGIYGSSQNKFGAYFTEQTLKSSKVLLPLDQIVNKQAKKQVSLSNKLFADLHSSPPTFVLRIITSPNTIQYKIWQKGDKEPTDFTTIKSSQPDLYLYHDIGCMSPGAIAQFKFIKPQDLLFSTTAQTTFAQEVEAMIAS